METRPSGVAVAFELLEVATQMIEVRYRRDHPGASEASVPAEVQRWLYERRGAPNGDAPGRARALAGMG